MNPSDNHPLIGDENSVANRKIRNLKKLVVLLSLVLVVLIVVFGIVFIVDESDGDDDDLPNKTNPNTIVNHAKLPAIICGWNFTLAALAGHRQMMGNGSAEIGGTSAVDALEHAGNQCELNPNLCRWSVGFGGSPNDLGQTTLDALLMDAKTMNVGAVGSLYRVKKAISVARKVLDHTSHSLLVGNDATDFARLFNFTIEPNLESPHSQALMAKWRNNSYEPNFFVDFDPYPYKNHTLERKRSIESSSSSSGVSFDSHDTLPMVAIDKNGDVACGATTNGLTYKIHGRVGDSPIAGAGAYCDNNVGGAACTGDGDTMMRFLPSYFAVQQLRAGKTPQQAADSALEAMQKFYPKVQGCILVLAKSGEYGAASTANWPLIPFVTQIGAQQDTPQQRCIGGTPEQCLKHLHSN